VYRILAKMTGQVTILWKTALILLGIFLPFFLIYLISSKIKGKPLEWSRLVSEFFFIVVILIILGLPPIFLVGFIAGLNFLGIGEIYQVVKAKDPTLYRFEYKFLAQAGGLVIPFLFFFFPHYVRLGLILILVILFCLPVFATERSRPLDKMARALVALIFAIMLSFLVHIRVQEHGVALCIFLIFLTNISDSGAYVFGKMFGRTKLAPKLSPGKTVEGSFFAILVTLGVALLFRQFILPEFSLQVILGLGLLIAVGAQLGDIGLSVFKRDVGIKDYGKIIPGHGGILDRFDSLVISTPLFYYFIIFWG